MSVGTIPKFDYQLWQPRLSLAQATARVLIFTLMSLSILAPAITITPTLPWMKAEQLLLPLVFLLYGWMLLSGSARLIRLNGMFIVGGLFCFSVLLSIWYGADILHHPVIFRDYYELPKVWLPVIFFTIALEADLSEASLQRLLSYFAASVSLVCLYAWAQFANLGFTYKLNNLYSAGSHIDIGLRNHGRVYSTMGNANVLGQLMTWAIVGFTMAFLFRVGGRARNILVAFACLVTLAMTGSRYGLLTATIGLVMILALPSASNRRRLAQLGLLVLILPAFVWSFDVTVKTNQGNAQRLASLRHPLEVDSLRSRLDDLWLDAANDFVRSPFVGYGPAKSFYTGVYTDSEFLDVLKEFGIVGFLPYLAYYLFPMFLLWRGLRAAKRAGPLWEERFPATSLTLRLAFVFAVTALVMNIGESTFYNQLLQAFLWLWLGLGVSCARRVPWAPTDLTGRFYISGGEREFTLEGSWYADKEIQSGADRETSGRVQSET
jgi:O-antigen ligase